jgi:hypothetical protein
MGCSSRSLREDSLGLKRSGRRLDGDLVTASSGHPSYSGLRLDSRVRGERVPETSPGHGWDVA